MPKFSNLHLSLKPNPMRIWAFMAIICGTFSLFINTAQAARDAVVVQDKAIIWSDAQRTSPLGFARRGKIIRVGDKERERGQVVPVIISGKVGYVAIEDLSFEDTNKKVTDEDIIPTRFKEATQVRYGEYVVGSYTRFASTESKNSQAGRVGDNWNFNGGMLKGAIATSNERIGLNFLGEYLYTENQDESFRVFELGMGVSLALIDFRRFKIRAEVFGLVVPWSQYESRPLFTLNGYGGGALAQGTGTIFFTDSVGVEVGFGYQALKIFNIKRPSPFKPFSPFFSGTRLNAGLVIRF
ncbi:MAG: hypothetical protein K2P81_01130 [Bacteriovoracaceae bacterium]|nr:hypothetical protein [Bacteriovoracaceae bacterium]